MNSIAADLVFVLVTSILLMFITWLVSVRIKNAGLVDIAWSGGFTLMVLILYWLADGWFNRKLVLTLVVMSWSMRLALHLVQRLRHEFPEEDSRYKDMRKSFGASANLKFLGFFQIQALVLAALSSIFCVIAENSDTAFSALEISGFALFVVALMGEWFADRQLADFKKDATNKGEVCQVGLWKYSRHPNYFFEFLVWVAFYVMACAAPYGVFTFYCPLLMLLFLLKVSGVPLAEQQSLKSKGDKYRAYQRVTSEFFPWFRKES